MIVSYIILFMSSSESPRRSPEPQQKLKPHKVFVTNLEINVTSAKLEEELRQKFSKYGKLDSVVAKRSYNNQYCFAFIEYKEGEDAAAAVKELNNTNLCGKKMKAQLQDNSRRRKGGQIKRQFRNQTCYHCGKPGHYARNCRQNKEREDNERSRSGDRHHKKSKKKRHHRSESSDSSADRRKKQKKHSKKVKKHSSKHKKERRRSDSDSSA